MPTSEHEWVAVMRCGRCKFPIKTVPVEVSDADGAFILEELPGRCVYAGCQAGFDAQSAHALRVTMYRRQKSGATEGTD